MVAGLLWDHARGIVYSTAYIAIFAQYCLIKLITRTLKKSVLYILKMNPAEFPVTILYGKGTEQLQSGQYLSTPEYEYHIYGAVLSATDTVRTLYGITLVCSVVQYTYFKYSTTIRTLFYGVLIADEH